MNANDEIAELRKQIEYLNSLFSRRLLEDKDKKQLIQSVGESLKRQDELAKGLEFKQLFSELLLALDRFSNETPSVELNETFIDELLEIFSHYGLTAIDNDGIVNLRLHEIVGTVPVRSDGEVMEIVEVKRPGYLLGNTVLRPSRVVVTK